MRDTILTTGYMGTIQCNKVLQPGMVQYMTFQADDEPPFYKSNVKNMKLPQKQKMELKTQEIWDVLKAAEVSKYGNVECLKELCIKLHIPITEQRPVIIFA